MVIVQHPSEPNPNEPRRYSRVTEIGGARDRCSAYLAHSDRIGPGVVVLHEFFGLTEAFRTYCDALNEEGFTALAPDLYDGRIASTVAEAEALRDEMDPDRTMQRLKAAVDHLTANWHPRVGVIGFSLGAWWASKLAQETDVDATVLYYGTPDPGAADRSGPLLVHLAEDDEWESLGEARSLLVELEDAGVDVEVGVYPGTTHWFANRDTEAFDADASAAAWQASIEFLRYHLA